MRVVVIGAGIIGLSSAYELSKDGHEVTVIDAGPPGHGASIGCAAKIALAECAPVPAPGMVLQGLKWMLDPDSPLYVRPSLSPSSLRFMVAMAKHCNAADFRRGLETHLSLASTCLTVLDEWKDEGLAYEEHSAGILLAYEHKNSFDERRAYDHLFAKYDQVPKALDAQAVHEMEPCLSERIQYGLFYSQDRQVEPQSMTDALAKLLEERGHRVVSHEPVVGFERAHGRIQAVRTDVESYPCDIAVLAAGVFCGPLSRQLGSPLPIRPGKGYSVDYMDAPTALKTPLTFEDAHVAVTPLNGMLRIAGTMEFAGFDTKVQPRRVEAMKRSAAAGFADWDSNKQHTQPWAGLRPMTPDGLPVVGRVPGYENAVVASGHGMLGLTLAPSTAKSVASIVRGEAGTELLQSIGPQRF